MKTKEKCYYCSKKIKSKKDKKENFNLINLKNMAPMPWHCATSVPVEDFTYYHCKIPCALDRITPRDPHIDAMSEKIISLMRIGRKAIDDLNKAMDEVSELHIAEVKRISAIEMMSFIDGKKR